MLQIVLLIHILVCIAIVALVLLQQGKGADMGAAFGSGASNTLFGSRGPASFLMKVTGSFVVIFFVTSLFLGYLASSKVRHDTSLTAPPPIAVKLSQQEKTQPNAAKTSDANQLAVPDISDEVTTTGGQTSQ